MFLPLLPFSTHNISFDSFGTYQTNQIIFLQNSIQNQLKDRLVALIQSQTLLKTIKVRVTFF